jgi:hypothetical protein
MQLISEITRRDLWEVLAGVHWWGRLSEVDFLKRLYPVDELPSTDARLRSAAHDIVQHRVANDDWADDWVFHDDRFALSNGDDDTLLRFLSEMLHPAVRKQEESERLASAVNGLLRADGYQVVQNGAVSGRPTYGWERVDPTPAARGDAHFTKDVGPLVATLAEMAQHDGLLLEQDVLRSARPRLEEPEYDNWDGGTYYYTLTLLVPVALFARLGTDVSALEQRIAKRTELVLRAPDRRRLTAVVIQPELVSARKGTELDRVISDRSERPVPQFWTPGQFRLFLSHVSLFKQRTAALRQVLSRYHISAFVAHDTIEAGELWQREIEAALRSMDAMVAVLTPGFHESKWTDQEIGWALGRGIYLLPLRKGLDPYGFIAEVQGIQAENKTLGGVAEEIFAALLRHSKTRDRIREALVIGLENSGSATEVLSNTKLIELAGSIPSSLLRRLGDTVEKNQHVRASGAADRIRRIIRTTPASPAGGRTACAVGPSRHQ